MRQQAQPHPIPFPRPTGHHQCSNPTPGTPSPLPSQTFPAHHSRPVWVLGSRDPDKTRVLGAQAGPPREAQGRPARRGLSRAHAAGCPPDREPEQLPLHRQRHARRDDAEIRVRQRRHAGPLPLTLGEHERGDGAVARNDQRDGSGLTGNLDRWKAGFDGGDTCVRHLGFTQVQRGK